MGDWLLNLPIPWMAVVIFAGIYVVAAAIYLIVIGSPLVIEPAPSKRFRRECCRHFASSSACWLGLSPFKSGMISIGPKPQSPARRARFGGSNKSLSRGAVCSSMAQAGLVYPRRLHCEVSSNAGGDGLEAPDSVIEAARPYVCYWHIADSFRRRTACLLSGVKRTLFPKLNKSANDPKRTSAGTQKFRKPSSSASAVGRRWTEAGPRTY